MDRNGGPSKRNFSGCHGTAKVRCEAGIDALGAPALAEFLREALPRLGQADIEPARSDSALVVNTNRVRFEDDLDTQSWDVTPCSARFP